jgi:type VI secretion system protein ImpH
MADASGPAPGAVADSAAFFARLVEAPHAQGFYQTMRLIEAAFPDRPRFGRSTRPSQDAVRLGQEPDVVFAASTLARWEPREELPPRLLVAFFGLFGTDGPLPLHLTEFARDRKRLSRDPTLSRFADIFHHRALSLFWRAWADTRPTLSFDRPREDRFATYVGALMGLGMQSLRERDAMPDLTKLHFAGRFANQTRPAEGLAAILAEFYTMPVSVACFIGAWLTLETRDRTRIGERKEVASLGQSVLLGGRVWTRSEKFRIVFGPLSLDEYERLLPGGSSFHTLVPIVRLYAGDTLMWDVNLILKRDEIPPIKLGQQGRLGWTTWLMPRRTERDAADLFLDASADSLTQNLDSNVTPTTEIAA